MWIDNPDLNTGSVKQKKNREYTWLFFFVCAQLRIMEDNTLNEENSIWKTNDLAAHITKKWNRIHICMTIVLSAAYLSAWLLLTYITKQESFLKIADAIMACIFSAFIYLSTVNTVRFIQKGPVAVKIIYEFQKTAAFYFCQGALTIILAVMIHYIWSLTEEIFSGCVQINMADAFAFICFLPVLWNASGKFIKTLLIDNMYRNAETARKIDEKIMALLNQSPGASIVTGVIGISL